MCVFVGLWHCVWVYVWVCDGRVFVGGSVLACMWVYGCEFVVDGCLCEGVGGGCMWVWLYGGLCVGVCGCMGLWWVDVCVWGLCMGDLCVMCVALRVTVCVGL